MKRRGLEVLLVVGALTLAARAEATQFVVTVKNTTSTAWSAGLMSLSPLITVGEVPSSSAPEYAAYAFATGSCFISDGYCTTGSCEDGQPGVLAQRRGLTLGTDAWLVPALAAGQSASVAIDVAVATSLSPQPHLSYLARAGTTDDFVAMHRVGDTDLLSSGALFDSAGMPVANVAFEIGGYDANANNASDGSSGACAPTCGTSAPGCYVAPGNVSTGGTLFAQPADPVLDNPWTYAAGGNYTTDGLALGPVSGADSGNALVVVENGYGWNSATWDMSATGQAVVLSSLASSAPSSYGWSPSSAGAELMGFPTIENLTSTAVPATGAGQFIVQEFVALSPGPGASVHARNSDSSDAMWTSTGYGYPGFWNMGASTGDVRTDASNPGDEVIIPTWTGDLAVLKHDTAETLNSYSLFSQASGDNLYGHVAIGDVLGTGSNQIVAYGAATGAVYVMSAPAAGGDLLTAWTSTPPSGLYAFASGPAVADLDHDGHNEIIVVSAADNRVYAYDPTYGTGCKYQWTIPGADTFASTSPVVGDVDGDGDNEVVVFANNAQLSVLGVPAAPTDHITCATGTPEWSYTVGTGGPAWFTPALADLTGSGALDIVVASYTTLEVVDASLEQVAFRFSDPTASFYPSAVVEARTGADTTSPAAAIYASGWGNGKVYRLTTPSTSPVPGTDWPTFMGNNARTGAR
ncbi:MAG: FG-GAP-like repeat-containing protein [Polyangia bacterium]